MPLILISGYPSSGKTTRAQQLVAYFDDRIGSSTDPRVARLKVHHINDQTLGLSRDVYHAARPEKDARAALYSAVKRALGRDAIVVADALNYIKGFRYQLYCEAKALQTPSCVVHVGMPPATARAINARLLADPGADGGYAPDDFEALLARYEEPNGMARWDSPLFTVLHDDAAPPGAAIWDALVGRDGRAKPVRPNQATVLTPAPSQDALYELDRTTSAVVAQVLAWQHEHAGAAGGAEVPVAGAELPVRLPAAAPVSLPQLQRVRRQFVALNRLHGLEAARVGTLFVDYLNRSFGAGG